MKISEFCGIVMVTHIVYYSMDVVNENSNDLGDGLVLEM